MKLNSALQEGIKMHEEINQEEEEEAGDFESVQKALDYLKREAATHENVRLIVWINRMDVTPNENEHQLVVAGFDNNDQIMTEKMKMDYSFMLDIMKESFVEEDEEEDEKS